ncbi:MAG TPA: hypothetical protein VD788_11805 [Candidatus Polarisedimenticolaceae bacterium]|nr:hypothetical protein [Candidatus Polarisedimenticolaceae bacterium]
MHDDGRGRDLSARLTVFGAGAVLIGCGLVALALLHLALPRITRGLDAGGTAVDPATAWMGAALYSLLGLALVGSGVGSIRKRRWVRPIMLFISGTWLMVGSFVTGLVVLVADDLVALAAGDLIVSTPELVGPVRALMIGLSAGFGLVLPALFFWAYRDRDVETTCARHSPGAGWSDRCPPAVLALSAALAGAGLIGLPSVFRPVFPLFGRVATGWPAVVGLLMVSAWCLWLGWSTFRLEREGWWGTLVFFTVLGWSTVVTALAVDPLEFYLLLGYDEEQLELLRPSAGAARWLMVGSSVALTVLGVVYLLGVRRHFSGRRRTG